MNMNMNSALTLSPTISTPFQSTTHYLSSLRIEPDVYLA